ncbi:MAG: HAE1 family hydrophobic/amphiphilic exporter-1, partial [Pirellulaceae bacterium]
MKSIVRWSINNSAGLNIIVIAVLAVGTLAFIALRRESFPEFDLDRILVTVVYPGAAPQEVEQAICLKIEAAVRSVEGIKKVTSVASEGAGNIVLELESNVLDPDQVVDDVRSAVDRIPSFPEESEDAEIAMVTSRRTAIRVGIIGPATEDERGELKLRQLAEQVHDDLLLLAEISQVDVSGGRNYQVDIEIPEETLRAHNLTLRRVAETVRRENRELPAGSIRSESQEVLLRANNRKTRGVDIAKIPLVTQTNGAVLTVGDLGTVRDEFVDTAAVSQINGKPGLALTVQRSKTEDLLLVVDAVKKYVSEKNMPYGYKLITWGDKSIEVRSRLELLLKNGWQGLLIVLVLLVLFLEIRLAFWVAMGIPFVFMITGSYLYLTGQTLNMISMFAFVMALGIVVDDAIVIGENIYVHRGMGKNFRQAAYDGTVEVMPSVVASVSTTIVAFSPLLFVSGVMGKFMAVMPAAIIAMLVASLVESVTILPCHLSHHDSLLFTFGRIIFYPFTWVITVAEWANKRASAGLAWFIETVYSPTLHWSLNHRIVVLAGCVGIMIGCAGLINSGIVRTNFFPKLDGNSLSANITFPDGTPESVTDKWTQHIEDAFWRVSDRYEKQGSKVASVSYRTVGQQVSSEGPGGSGQSSSSGSHVGTVEIELLSTEFRDIRSDRIAADWRKEVGVVPGTEELSIAARGGGPGGIAIEFKVLADTDHTDELNAMVDRCKEEMENFPGTFDVKDDSVPGKWEYRFRIKEQATAMGVRLSDLAESVRGAFYGEEVMRLQRGRHEVKLMVRYPKEQRQTLSNFDEIRVRLDDGHERPITELVEIDIVRGYSEINRIDQMRSITVSSDLDEKVGNADL